MVGVREGVLHPPVWRSETRETYNLLNLTSRWPDYKTRTSPGLTRRASDQHDNGGTLSLSNTISQCNLQRIFHTASSENNPPLICQRDFNQYCLTHLNSCTDKANNVQQFDVVEKCYSTCGWTLYRSLYSWSCKCGCGLKYYPRLDMKLLVKVSMSFCETLTWRTSITKLFSYK